MKSEVRYMVIELDSQYEKRKQEIEKIVKNVIEKQIGRAHV